MPNLTIRPANLADAAVIAEYNRRLAWESEHVRLDEAVLLAGVTAGLEDPHKGFYTVAERGGEVVGQTLVTFEWSDWRNGWFWWIQSVYVREDARRGGVFRALYQHVQERATADPTVIGLRLYVEADNARAKQTYRSLGMTDTSYGLLEIYPLPGRAKHLGGLD
ncbi:GNAT family N-acetyltransferase [Limnoglobus roseus]|uniref:N-acetyltransferase n=1 Tax=Limnoglobus roseus TaxID=2598579 RepID=A0A5C1AAV9_9BACT|nr:GNAT family N-acetyltransferase [Limnoglobus roseus]QEL15156.1 N-acetyltransferase [Limnoglobus roseus]